MAKDDWRLRIELGEGRSYPLLERLGLVHDEADELARELKHARLAVTHDSDTVFVYAATSLDLEKATAIVERELQELNATAQPPSSSPTSSSPRATGSSAAGTT